MNTETHILKDDLDIDLEKIKIPNLNEDEIAIIESYVEITRHIQEIEKLFNIFRCNRKIISNNYTLYNNDTIKRNKICTFEEDDYVVINTLVINFLSSGKTLVESVENYMKSAINPELRIYNDFKCKCINRIYDTIFSYRLLIRLRDFSQHGHLPISGNFSGGYCFDLNRIISTPHFNHNKKIEEEMIKLEKEIYEKFKGYPRICFTKSIAEFNLCIIEIYVEFLNAIENFFYDVVQKVNLLLNQRPVLIYKSTDSFNNHVFYKDCNGFIHCFNSKNDSKKMFLEFKQNAMKIFDYEKNAMKALNDSIKFKKNSV